MVNEKMPKKSKPRKPVSSNYEDAPRGRTKRDKLVRAVSMLLVFGLVATFLIGALAGSPAGAAERVAGQGPAHGQAVRVLNVDTDGDGIENNEDSDLDGDGVVNGVDPDIDGDGIENSKDGDPVGTLGDTPEIQSPPKDVNEAPSVLGQSLDDPWIRVISIGAILGLGAVIWSARRKQQ